MTFVKQLNSYWIITLVSENGISMFLTFNFDILAFIFQYRRHWNFPVETLELSF
jgi:hypothetical protein